MAVIRLVVGHHSLVTPIDWKHVWPDPAGQVDPCHHSLVTPIDWKLHPAEIA